MLNNICFLSFFSESNKAEFENKDISVVVFVVIFVVVFFLEIHEPKKQREPSTENEDKGRVVFL